MMTLIVITIVITMPTWAPAGAPQHNNTGVG